MSKQSLRRCPARRCPHLILPGVRYCPEHMRAYEAKRGSRHERGYGTRHVRTRERYARKLQQGETIFCARCKKRIMSYDRWHLDHSDDRMSYLGISHASCNTRAGGRKAHKQQ